MEVLLITLLIVIAVLTYLVVNLAKKIEKYEELTLLQRGYMQKISDFIGESQGLIQNLDEKGVFEADDEIGDFFRFLKNIQESLNKFNINLKNE